MAGQIYAVTMVTEGGCKIQRTSQFLSLCLFHHSKRIVEQPKIQIENGGIFYTITLIYSYIISS